VFSPFSGQAKVWEPHGQRLRALAGCGRSEILDPYKLAPKLNLTVMPGEAALALLSPEIRNYLSTDASNEWSGGVLPYPLPDGTFLCILNPAHAPTRNRMTLMEEIAHRYMNHCPTKVLLDSSELRARDFDRACEKEAYGIGAAALLPWSQLFELINSGHAVDSIADHFEVSQQLIEYRIKITGASRLYAARQRTRMTERRRSVSAVPYRAKQSA
jgi:hypothetical protein